MLFDLLLLFWQSRVALTNPKIGQRSQKKTSVSLRSDDISLTLNERASAMFKIIPRFEDRRGVGNTMRLKFAMSETSVFAKVFLSFLAVILIFSSFYFMAFSHFKKTIKEDIFRANEASLRYASERFEAHLNRLKTLLLNMNDDAELVGFNHQLLAEKADRIDYLKAEHVIRTFKDEIFKHQYDLETILVHFRSSPFAFSHTGSGNSEIVFGQIYSSGKYTPEYWREQLESGIDFRILPADRFVVDHLTKSLLPIAYRKPGSNYQLVALWDMDKAYEALADEESLMEFIMLDAGGTLLYRTGDMPYASLPTFKGKESITSHNGNYYFLDRQPDGTTYISAVPESYVTGQINRMSRIVLLILVLSLSIVIAAAYLFSRRIQSPVKHLLSAILSLKPAAYPKQQPKEFHLIHEKINDLVREKEQIAQTIRRQSPILENYHYMSRLKSINTSISEWEDFLATERSYIVVLYTLRYRKASTPDAGEPSSRIPFVRSILEFIHLRLSDRHPGSNTFQIENHQIVSVVTGTEREPLMRLMNEMKTLLNRELSECAVTIAIGERFEHSSEFNRAYLQVQEMSRQINLSGETQLVAESIGQSPFALTPKQELLIRSSLQAGNEEGAIQTIGQVMEHLNKNRSRLKHYEELATIIGSIVSATLESLKLKVEENSQLELLLRNLAACFTLEEYESCYRTLLSFAASLIRNDKEDRDPVASLVMDILHKRYDQDLSLSQLADMLNMSSTYLSVYIKDKTGANFSDHLNGIRVRKAQELLITTEMNITEIGNQVGYSNFTSFNRMFKKQTGMAPTEYRKQQINRIHRIG